MQSRMFEQLGIRISIHASAAEVRTLRGITVLVHPQPGLCRKTRQSIPAAIKKSMEQRPDIVYALLDEGKRRLNTLLTRMTADSQTSRTWRSRAKPTRQWVPSPGSMVAVRLLMRTMVPTTVCRYLSSKATFSPHRKSLRVGRGAAGGSGATA